MPSTLTIASASATPPVAALNTAEAATITTEMIWVTMEPPVLDYFSALLSQKPEYLEMMVMNGATSDATIARIARSAGEKILELVAQNQLLSLLLATPFGFF